MDVSQLLKNFGVALTGGIATGKSTIAHILRQLGYIVVDADQLAREVVAPGSVGHTQIVTVFGQAIASSDGSLDRRKLRALIMQDPIARQKLEAITHPLIAARLAEKLIEFGLTHKPSLFFYEAALILETGNAQKFFAVLASHCPRSIQVERLQGRDQVSAEEAEASLASQMPADDKAKRATLAIATDCSLAELERRVVRAVAALQALHKKSNKH